MDIKDVLDERIICSSLETKDKEDALKQLSAKLEETGYIDDKDAFLKISFLENHRDAQELEME